MSLEFVRGVPEKIQQGDTLRFYVTDTDDPPGTGATYKAAFVTAEKTQKLTAQENLTEGRYEFEVSAAETGDWPAGDYRYELYVELAGNVVETRYAGPTEVVAALRNMGAGRDLRSHAKKMIEAIEAVLADTASQYQMSQTVTTAQGSRALQFIPKGELLALRSDYEAELAYLEDRERQAKGLGGGGNIRTVFRG